jgi:HlyD family secretion protein
MFGSHRLAFAFSAALLSIVLTGCQGSSGNSTEVSAPAGRIGVAALGRLEPRDRVAEISVSGDERIDRILVKQGDFVKGGHVLAYLQSYDSRLATRNRAAAMLKDAEARLHADMEQGEARIQEATLRLHQLREVPSLEIQAQEARIREIQTDLDLALKDLERLRGLLEPSVIPRQEFDRQSARVDRLRATLQSEQSTLQKLTRAAATDKGIAEAQLATRGKELNSVRASAQIASLEKALQVADAELKESVIRAPSDGQIIEVIANPGEAVQGRVILRMGDVREMYVLAEVYETDMSRVQLGQSVDVTSPALSKPLTGKVDLLGTSVFKRQVRSVDPQADADARVVQVRVRLDESEEASRFVGLQVDLLFHTDK